MADQLYALDLLPEPCEASHRAADVLLDGVRADFLRFEVRVLANQVRCARREAEAAAAAAAAETIGGRRVHMAAEVEVAKAMRAEWARLGWSTAEAEVASTTRARVQGTIHEPSNPRNGEILSGHDPTLAQAPSPMTRPGGSPLSTPARSHSAHTKPDPALDVRSAAPAARYEDDLSHLVAGVRAMRLPPDTTLYRGTGRGTLDSHLPHFARLEGRLWEKARALPTETEIFFMGSSEEAQRWCDFLGRVLPPADPPGLGLLAYGRWSSIHNEDLAHDTIFVAAASTAERAAAFAALGWDGQPTRQVLLEHMLCRVEHEYAQHLLDHKFTPGEWCRECKCFCAGRQNTDNSEDDDTSDGDHIDDPAGDASWFDDESCVNVHDFDGILGLDDPTDA